MLRMALLDGLRNCLEAAANRFVFYYILTRQN